MKLNEIRMERSAYFVIALFSSAIFFLFWFISAITDGTWTFGGKTLSDLGISENQVSVLFFNSACIISGLLAIVHGYGWYRNASGKYRYGGITLAISGLFLALVGVFTLNTGDPHRFVACSMGVFASISVVISFINDYMNKRLWLILFTVIIMIIFFVTFFAVLLFIINFEVFEPIAIICALIWIPINGYKVSNGMYEHTGSAN